ncbi:MAG: AAA family ATPase [Bacilli bacterium]|nr:AAA family ATPase [Bacilli bacterium]
MLVAKICLTGGPCAGKSTALSKIEQKLTDMGYKVFVIEEGATRLINAGIKPFGNDSISMFDFEDIVLKDQLLMEDIFTKTANLLNKKCIILCDRGVFDIKSFITEVEFDALLNKYNLSKMNLISGYNLVIHLNTIAKGKQELYADKSKNNSARSEDVKEAVLRDDKCEDAWSIHENLKIIDNSTDFDTKINKVIDEITNYLGVQKRNDRKYLVELTDDLNKFIRKKELVKVKIKQTYLYTDKDCEIRLRKRTIDNDSSYYITVKKNNYENQKIITDEIITKEEYERLLSSTDVINVVEKERICFVNNDSFYKLDIFENNMCLLETSGKLDLPDSIKVIKEVTNLDEYYNINIKKESKKKVLLR